jgi:hypothetical protein
MGVLTKPDLATETATRDTIVDLVMGKRSELKLGYYVVKNRSADDQESSPFNVLSPKQLSSRLRLGLASETNAALQPSKHGFVIFFLRYQLKSCLMSGRISKYVCVRAKSDLKLVVRLVRTRALRDCTWED